MIWTPERIAQARQRNFGESVTLTAQDWDAMLDMAERWRVALKAIAAHPEIGIAFASSGQCMRYMADLARKALDGGDDAVHT